MRCSVATRPFLRQAGVAAVRAFSSDTTTLSKLSYNVIPKEDFGAYKEYSVIFTNRSLNLMSDPFQRVMRDLNNLLKETYNADKVAIVPGWVCFLLYSLFVFYSHNNLRYSFFLSFRLFFFEISHLHIFSSLSLYVMIDREHSVWKQ